MDPLEALKDALSVGKVGEVAAGATELYAVVTGGTVLADGVAATALIGDDEAGPVVVLLAVATPEVRLLLQALAATGWTKVVVADDGGLESDIRPVAAVAGHRGRVWIRKSSVDSCRSSGLPAFRVAVGTCILLVAPVC